MYVVSNAVSDQFFFHCCIFVLTPEVSIPVAIEDARLGTEFTRDLNYFELENPKEYSLYFEGFPIQNNLKVDLKSDASSRIFNGDGYIIKNDLDCLLGNQTHFQNPSSRPPFS